MRDLNFIPISALKGDNVVNRSSRMDWYQGSTLMYLLENIHIAGDRNHIDRRFPVQHVIRPMTDEWHDFRGFAGQIAGGIFRTGDAVQVLPSGFQSTIKSIHLGEREVQEAFAPQSVVMTLNDEIDISRGDMIVSPNNLPKSSQDIDVMLCWLNERPLQPNGKYALKHTSRDARCMVKEVTYKMDINTLRKLDEDKQVGMNDIGRVLLRTTVPLHFDNYARNRNTGSLILVDEATNETVAAGMIV